MNEKARPSRLAIGTSVTLTLVFAGIITGFINYFASRHYKTLDLSGSDYFTLSDKTVNVVKGLKEPVEMYFFFNPEHQLFDKVRTLLRSYQNAAGEKLKFEVIDPNRDLLRAQTLAERFRLTDYDDVVILAQGDKSKFVNADAMAEMDFGNPMMGTPPRMRAFKAEEAITSALVSLAQGEPARVYFLAGHGEGDIEGMDPRTGFSELNERIKRENIQTAKLNLAVTPEIPTNTAALVILGPRQPFQPAEVDLINKYLDANGRLLVFLDPMTRHGLEGVLGRYGVEAREDLVMGAMRMMGERVLAGMAPATEYASHPVVDKLRGVTVLFSNSRSFKVAADQNPGAVGRPVELAKAPESFWGESDPTGEAPAFNEGKDNKGPVTLAVAVDTGKVGDANVDLEGARLVAGGSSTMFMNSQLLALQGGLDFFLNALNWALKKETQMGIAPKQVREFTINLLPAQMNTLAVTVCGLVPLCLLAVGIAVWLQRRV